MSIITAIFQAIAQALTWIFPISESGHSAVFHDLSGRYTNSCSQLTGVVHIGIAAGIFIAFFRLFAGLFKNFIGGWSDLLKNGIKGINTKNRSAQRNFMYMTICSFVPFLLYLIPAGRAGNLFMLFHRTSFNGNLLGEGICFLLTGALILLVVGINGFKIPLPDFLKALIIGIAAFFAFPFAGCSFVFAIYAAAFLLGLGEKNALRYAMVLSVPTLITTGVIEICIAVTKISVVSAIIGFVISAVFAFFAVKLFIYVIKIGVLKYFAFYDFSVGAVSLIIGIFEIASK